MVYNENTVQRIREFFLEKNAPFIEKKMFRGICFMVDDKMCCTTHIDKKTGEDMMLCRIGEAEYEKALEKNYVIPMEFTGKSMTGYIYVTEPGIKTDKDLRYWLQLCLDFNPHAKASKKK
jgi:hypothetical protein